MSRPRKIKTEPSVGGLGKESEVAMKVVDSSSSPQPPGHGGNGRMRVMAKYGGNPIVFVDDCLLAAEVVFGIARVLVSRDFKERACEVAAKSWPFFPQSAISRQLLSLPIWSGAGIATAYQLKRFCGFFDLLEAIEQDGRASKSHPESAGSGQP